MKTVRIGLLGLGNVGAAFAKSVEDAREMIARRDRIDLVITRMGVADPGKTRPEWIPMDRVVGGWEAVVDSGEVDIVVELIGGVGEARKAVVRALERGLHVVSANKALLAREGVSLFGAACSGGGRLRFEAAVGGGVPVIAALTESLSGNRCTSIVGIVNGTCNYILSRMTEDGLSYGEALRSAQEKGFAESDPGFDVDGLDAAQKLQILSTIAFGIEVGPGEIYTEGITRVSPEDIELVSEFGYAIKLLAIARRSGHGVEMRVHPALVDQRHPLAAVRDEFNAFFLTGDLTGEIMLYGRGAGPSPTASAVLSDVLRLAAGDPGNDRCWTWDDVEHVPIGDVVTGYHMFFPVLDRAGVIGRIASTLGSYGINIESAHAHLPPGRSGQGMVQILSRRARERDVRAALDTVTGLPVLTGKPWFYRIEG